MRDDDSRPGSPGLVAPVPGVAIMGDPIIQVYKSQLIPALQTLEPIRKKALAAFVFPDAGSSFLGIGKLFKLYLALPVNKNLFEPNVFSTGVKSDYLQEYFRYLDLVKGIVEDLNLNLRIWGKQ